MKRQDSKHLFRGFRVGLLGFALAGLGFAIAASLSKPIGAGVIWLGVFTAVAGFVIHLLAVLERFLDKHEHR